MGGSSSKAVRTLPKQRGTSAMPSGSSAKPTESLRVRLPTIQASEVKNEDIEMHSKDPGYLANLARLGPVKVDHHMAPFQPASSVKKAHMERVKSEREATTSSLNQSYILASTLRDLLQERKGSASAEDVKHLANKYGFDSAKLESLTRFINTPSSLEGSERIRSEEDGQEVVVRMAAWREPATQTLSSPK